MILSYQIRHVFICRTDANEGKFGRENIRLSNNSNLSHIFISFTDYNRRDCNAYPVSL